jgi:Ca-activated chloride channel family protein
VSEAGTYLLRVDARDGDEAIGQRMVGLVVPYSPEYKATGTDESLLGELARLTGGGELAEPLHAFLHDLPSADRAREIWRPMLLAVALLFPVDVAVRRLVLGRRDMREAIEWLRVHSPFPGRGAGEREPMLGQLFAARDRARVRRERAASREPTEEPMPADARAAPQGLAKPQQDRPAGVGAVGPEDTLARLRRAKGRARRDE